MVKCPNCDSEMNVMSEEIDIPHFGRTIISTAKCASCGYKFSDVWCIDEKEPVKLTLKVESPEDMSSRVVKSSNATVMVPELGTEIKPGPASQGYISNVEGILKRVEDAMKGMKVTVPEKESKLDELLASVASMREGKTKFTLIIEDPSGNSSIDSEKTVVEKLEKAKLQTHRK